MNQSYPAGTPFIWRESDAGPLLEARMLSGIALNGVTTRALRFREPSLEADYAALAGAFDVDPSKVLRVRQVHGNRVVVVHAAEAGVDATDADAIICTDPERVASVRIADCVPLLVADSGRRLVAAVHAGWRGTAAGVARETIRCIESLGVPADRLIVAIGPSIGPCCYQVSEDVRQEMVHRWQTESWFTRDGERHWKLDLWRANRDQLLAAGVRPAAITVAGLCTIEHGDRFFSHRREGENAGRMVAAIRLLAG